MFRLFLAVVRRDLKLALRQKSDVLNTVFFFIVVVTLVPLGIGPDQQLLRMIAPGVVWVAALLAAFHSRVFLPMTMQTEHWSRCFFLVSL